MPTTSLRQLLIAGTALGLSACTTLGPDFARPETPAVDGYSMQGDPILANLRLVDVATAGPWWTALGSPKLDAAIREALAGSPTVTEAQATLAKVQADLIITEGLRQPTILGSTGVSGQRINTKTFGISGFPSPTVLLFTIGGSVSYDLDLFGGQRRQIEGVNARVEAASHQADAAYLSLTGNVALQAVKIAGLNAQIAALEAVVADDRRVNDMVRRAQDLGGAPPSATSGGEAQLAQDQALIPPLRRELAAARHQLALLSGKPPSAWTALDFTLDDFQVPAQIELEAPSSIVRGRPDIRAAEAELHAATAQIGVTEAMRYPDIKLSASLTQTALKPLDIFGYDASGWNIGGALTGPPFDGKKLQGPRQAADAQARGAMARYQGVVLRAFTQVADALSALGTDDSQIEALRRAQAATGANLADNQKAYELGGGTLLSVVDAQRASSRARRALAAAEGQKMGDLVSLYTATAGASAANAIRPRQAGL